LLYIYDALGVPYGLLATEEAQKRSAAAQLLRRVPRLRNILIVEEITEHDFDPDWWQELDFIFLAIEQLIDCVAEDLERGDLDPIIGGYPDPGWLRPPQMLAPLEERIRDRVGPHETATWDTVEEALKLADREPVVLPEGYQPDIWLHLILHALLVELATWAQRAGWPLPSPGLD
jgi:hypothetical protein